MSTSSDVARLVGTWQLLESYSEGPAGRAAFPLGAKVIGRLNYDAAGNMAAQLMGEDRKPFSARDPREITDVEYRDAFQTYTAYYGTFEVNPAERTVTHHVLGATVPNWPGNTQLRYYELEGDRLILRTPPMRGNDGSKAVNTLVWQKIA